MDLDHIKQRVGDALSRSGLHQLVSIALKEARGYDNTIELQYISAEPQGHGNGTRAMALLLEITDEEGVDILLEVAGMEWDVDDDDPDVPERPDWERLWAWYETLGFEGFVNDQMMRSAGARPAAKRAPI